MVATRVVNLRRESYDVYIGRAGRGHDGYFGNPFPLGTAPRDVLLAKYRDYFTARVEHDPEYRKSVLALKGKVLGCFCKPQPCHGDVIVGWLERSEVAFR